MDSILEVCHLKKYYHSKKKEMMALKDISFSVYPGEILSIVGPSGCGKSTILSILCGLLSPSSGRVDYPATIKIAYMLQEDCLLPFKTVLDNCLLGLQITHSLTDESKKYVIHLLNTYGLGDVLHHYPSQLSGGMRQRCALIRTLALKPDILLLDEATSALDYQSSLIISNDIYHIIKKEKKTAIIVTHDIPLAISLSDRIIVLSNHPAKVKSTYSLSFDSSMTPVERRSNPIFTSYYEKIWRDLDVTI